MQNGAESFNGKLRDQHLSYSGFATADAKVSIEEWRRHYNEVRPHSSLRYLTPAEFKAKHLAGLDDGGRSPAMPARADRQNEELRTGPVSAVLQYRLTGPKNAGRSGRRRGRRLPVPRVSRGDLPELLGSVAVAEWPSKVHRQTFSPWRRSAIGVTTGVTALVVKASTLTTLTERGVA